MTLKERISPLIGLKKIDRANYYYIFVNLGLSAFSFIRSFVFMSELNLKDLGIISLVQTIFMFIGLLQMGLLNGGYRIISLGKKEEMERTNNTLYSYLAILLPVGIVSCLIIHYFNLIIDLSLTLLLIAVVFGIFTLLNNWYHNMLIGEQKLAEINRINIISYTLSAAMLPLAFVIGFWGAMIVIMIQPLSFVGLSLIRNKELMPTKFDFTFKYTRYILSFGFIPFISGIFSVVYLQVERWSIDFVLGVEALGAFYLVFLYVSLFQLVPTSINSIFFPKGVKLYSQRKYAEFKRILLLYWLAMLGYGLIIVIGTMLFLKPVVALVFPNHLSEVSLVYIILPGLIMASLIEPIGLILNAAVILKPILAVSAFNMIFCISLICIFMATKIFSLQNVAYIRMTSGVFVFCAYIISYFFIKKRLFV